MNDNLRKSRQHALQYWMVDGMGELSVGFVILLAVIIYYLQESTPGSLLSRIFSIASVLLVCGAAFGGHRIIQRIKERTTYPRTGYVVYNSGWGNKGDVAIAVGLAAFLISFVVFTTLTDTKLTDWGPVVCGLFMGILLVQAGYRSALPRFYVLAFLGLLIGAGLVVSGLSIVLSLPLFFGLNGLILLASGSLTLYKYLRQTPAPPGDAR